MNAINYCSECVIFRAENTCQLTSPIYIRMKKKIRLLIMKVKITFHRIACSTDVGSKHRKEEGNIYFGSLLRLKPLVCVSLMFWKQFYENAK